MELSAFSNIVTMAATVVIAIYAAASYRLASTIQKEQKYFNAIGANEEISETYRTYALTN